MILKIDPVISQKYPNLRIGIILGIGADNKTIPKNLKSLKVNSVKNLREKTTLESLSLDPRIIAWRDTYKSFGVKPKSHKPTAEALVRRIIKGDNLPFISPIVDLYLINELDNLLPIGGYDLDKLSGFISLEISKGDEEFLPLGCREIEKTKEGEVIYRDKSRILTRRWNWRDCDYTKITNETKNFVLFIEAALPQISTQALEKATKELTDSLKMISASEIKSIVYEPNKNSNTLSIVS